MDAQRQSAVQFVHKLTTVAAGGVVHGNRQQGFFAAQPGMADGALLSVHGLLHGGAEEFHIAAEVPGTADAAGNGADVKVGEVGTRTGRRQRQQSKGQRVFVQPRRALQRSDLICIEQGRKMRVGQHRGDGRLQVRRQLGKNSLKTWVHGVAS